MNGLIVIPAYYPDKSRGGAISGCRSFAKAISIKHDVEIITLDTTDQGHRVREVDGLKVSYLKGTKGLDWLSKTKWGFSLSFSKWFINNHKKYDYIYIRALWNYISLFSAIICIFSNKKYIISSSGKFSRFALKRSFWKKLLLLPLTYLIIRKSVFIHYPSIYEYESTPKIISNLTNKLILATGIDVLYEPSKFFNKEIKKRGKSLIYTVSRFDTIKRIEILANNASNLSANFDIVHVGNYEEKKEYFNQILDIYLKHKFEVYYDLEKIDNNSKKNRIFFAGYKEIDEVNNLIKSYEKTFLIQMSHSEGQSNSILEAMARGSVCIVSKGCNMQKASKVNAIKITNEENFTEDLNYLLNNKDAFIEMNKNQYIFLNKHNSFKNIAEDFNEKMMNKI
tara:strand:+ start:2988 stop:4172 length:1185 start_codon:yes stop_codon:yes gene_type:complete